jgi:hypothetical protein
MSREKGKRAAYTLEFKLEAVRLVRGGQAKGLTAKVLGIPGANAGQLGTPCSLRQARRGWRQAGECGANGACAPTVVAQEPYNGGHGLNRRLGVVFLPVQDRPGVDA